MGDRKGTPSSWWNEAVRFSSLLSLIIERRFIDSGGVSWILYEAACVCIEGAVFLLRRVAPSCTCMVEVIFLFRRFSPPCARTFTADFSACCSDLLFRRSAFLRSCLRRYDGVGRRFFVLSRTPSLFSEKEKLSTWREKENLHPSFDRGSQSSLQRLNQSSGLLLFGGKSIPAPVVAESVWLQGGQCRAHAYSLPVATTL